jgi:hypothetical protein
MVGHVRTHLPVTAATAMSSPAAAAPSSSGAPQPQPQMQQSEQQRERRMESLGWLTELAVMPKKHKAIEGVSAGSILDLKAQLYRTQEEARKPGAQDVAAAASGEFRRAKKPSVSADPLGVKNSGVDVRTHK